jgi:hypothetical protein
MTSPASITGSGDGVGVGAAANAPHPANSKEKKIEHAAIGKGFPLHIFSSSILKTKKTSHKQAGFATGSPKVVSNNSMLANWLRRQRPNSTFGSKPPKILNLSYRKF